MITMTCVQVQPSLIHRKSDNFRAEQRQTSNLEKHTHTHAHAHAHQRFWQLTCVLMSHKKSPAASKFSLNRCQQRSMTFAAVRWRSVVTCSWRMHVGLRVPSECSKYCPVEAAGGLVGEGFLAANISSYVVTLQLSTGRGCKHRHKKIRNSQGARGRM